MKTKIAFGPAFSLLVVVLDKGEETRCEPGAMVSMRGSVELAGKVNAGDSQNKGFFKRAVTAAKSVLGGESFFITVIRAEDGPGEVTLAPSVIGDIAHLKLDGGEAFIIQQGGYMANTPGVEVEGNWGGLRSFVGGEGLFLLRATGAGDIYLSSFGAIFERELRDGQRLIVDSGHMVAYTDGLELDVRMAAGDGGGGFLRRATTSLITGEGLEFEFRGPGKVWIQTRNPQEFVGWLTPMLPRPSGGGGYRRGYGDDDGSGDGSGDDGGDGGDGGGDSGE